MRKIILSIFILVFAGSLVGCSTIKGVGDDVKTVGNWISNGAQHVEQNMKKEPSGS